MEAPKDALAGKPRRPHHKSRTGCLQCKQRKVKCDEQKPVCKKCESHNLSCSYLQTHPLKRGPPTVQSMLPSPSPTSSSSIPQPHTPAPIPPLQSIPFPQKFSMLDLEILHWWTTTSVESFIDFDACIILFRTTIVELGFVHPFLMHEILSLSALHLSKERPHKAAIYQHASDTHLATALSLFQPEIANLNPLNCEACFAFSTMVFTHAWASQDPKKPSTLFFAPTAGLMDPDIVHVQWVKLHRGSVNILRNLFPSLREGLLLPLFAPWKGMDRNRDAPVPPVEDAQISALAGAWLMSSLSQPQKDTLDRALHTTRRIFSMLAYNPEISKLSAVMSWFSTISDDFIKMLEEKIPEALLIVVYYCVALKRADHMWWVHEKGENLLRTVLAELGGGWERWTTWAVEQVLGRMEEQRAMFSINNMLG